MRTLLAATALFCALPGCLLAQAIEPPSVSDSRIKQVQYSPDDVYTITTKYGYQTNVVFGGGEEIQTISVGDRSLWQIVPSGNRLFIRPMEENVTTNMTVITNRHSYQFDLRSVGAHGSGNVYVIRFSYPQPRPPVPPMAYTPPPRPYAPPPPPLVSPIPPAKPAPSSLAGLPIKHYTPPPAPYTPPPPPETVKAAKATSSVNTNYTYTGDDTLAPLEVSDNGSVTSIRFREGQSLPAVYAVDKDGNKHPVSYRVEDDVMMIQQISPEWLLENTGGNVEVYNETLEAQ